MGTLKNSKIVQVHVNGSKKVHIKLSRCNTLEIIYWVLQFPKLLVQVICSWQDSVNPKAGTDSDS